MEPSKDTIKGIGSFLDSQVTSRLADQKPQVLVVDDDPAIRRFVQRMLEDAGFQVATASDGAEAMEQILAAPPDLLLCDWKMPHLNGVELCHLVRQMQGEKYIYIILVSGRTETRHLVQAMAAGADDFISKPIRAGELFARLQAGLRILERERQLAYLASHDVLTGVLSRRALLEWIEADWYRFADEDRPLGCVMLDVDRFKRINDEFGHLVGDDVLRGIGGLLTQLATPDVHVGRYGGEEFCVFLEDAGDHDARRWAESCRQQLAATPIVSGEFFGFATASFGVSSRRGDGDEPTCLLNRADQALLLAKRAGRDRVAVFSEPVLNAPLT